jgi:hypothetical protein
MNKVKYDKIYVVDAIQFDVINTNDTTACCDDDLILDITNLVADDIVFQGAEDCDLFFVKKDNLKGLDYDVLEGLSILSTKNIDEFDFYIQTNFVRDYSLKENREGVNHILIRSEDYDDDFD